MSEIKIKIEKTTTPSSLSSWTIVTSSFEGSYVTYYIGNGGSYTSSLSSSFPSHTVTEEGLLTIPVSSNDVNTTGNNTALTWNIKPTIIEPIDSTFWYRLNISGSSPTTSSLFNPTLSPAIADWKLTIEDNTLYSNAFITPTGGHFWMFYSTLSKIYYDKIVLNSTSGNVFYNQDFVQVQLPYSASINSHFKGGKEPLDTQFPNVNDQWKVEIGDEIRFENNEEKSYKVLSVNIINNKLTLTLDRSIDPSTNLDFFLIRRYKESADTIIIDKTFPYTNPLPSASLAPSTTGFIFPKYPIDSIATGSDKIIRDLIDKKIIE
jgi:hypothetical protein